jgi:hypothetical protein
MPLNFPSPGFLPVWVCSFLIVFIFCGLDGKFFGMHISFFYPRFWDRGFIFEMPIENSLGFIFKNFSKKRMFTGRRF